MHVSIHTCMYASACECACACLYVCAHEYEHLWVHVSVYVCIYVKDRTQQTTPVMLPQAQLWPFCPSEYVYPKLGACWIAMNS